MEHFSDSTAWLAKRDGSTVIGHGPFSSSDSPPGDAVAFYVQDFAMGDTHPWKIPSSIEYVRHTEILPRTSGGAPLECEWTMPEPDGFAAVFQDVMASIRGGTFEKTVPVVTETGVARTPPGPALMAAMLRQHAPLRSYGWIHGEAGFAGATPELLFTLAGDRLETMALAGTARSEDRSAFAVDEKEIREHEYVAQTLVSKLLDLGKVDRQARAILDLGSIVHFLTLIRLDLHQTLTPGDLLRRLHPTPALGPLPRTAETLALLLDWRQRLGCPAEFGAPFGLWENGNFEAVVAIRGIWWEGRDLRLPAGCGIIEASRLVNEWRELRLKREAVKRSLLER